MNQQKIVFKSNDNNISGVIDFPSETPCPVVILLHGGTNTKDDCPMFDKIVPLLSQKGIASFRFDFFGTGESDGLFKEKNFTILDQNIKDAINLIVGDKRFTSIGLFGRSMSGGQVLYVNDDRIKARVVHSASIHPFVDISRFYPKEINDLVNNPELEEALIVSDPRKVKGEYAYSRKLIDESKLVPEKVGPVMPKLNNICIFQGDNDPETTVEEAIEIYNTVQKPKELHVMSGANHKYIGVEQETSFLTASWFKRYL